MTFRELTRKEYRGRPYCVCQDCENTSHYFVMGDFLTPEIKAFYGLDSTTSSASWMEELAKRCIDRLCKMEEFSQARQEMAAVEKDSVTWDGQTLRIRRKMLSVNLDPAAAFYKPLDLLKKTFKAWDILDDPAFLAALKDIRARMGRIDRRRKKVESFIPADELERKPAMTLKALAEKYFGPSVPASRTVAVGDAGLNVTVVNTGAVACFRHGACEEPDAVWNPAAHLLKVARGWCNNACLGSWQLSNLPRLCGFIGRQEADCVAIGGQLYDSGLFLRCIQLLKETGAKKIAARVVDHRLGILSLSAGDHVIILAGMTGSAEDRPDALRLEALSWVKPCDDEGNPLAWDDGTKQEQTEKAATAVEAESSEPVESVETSTTIEGARDAKACEPVEAAKMAEAVEPAAKAGLPMQRGKDDVIMAKPAPPDGSRTETDKEMASQSAALPGSIHAGMWPYCMAYPGVWPPVHAFLRACPAGAKWLAKSFSPLLARAGPGRVFRRCRRRLLNGLEKVFYTFT